MTRQHKIKERNGELPLIVYVSTTYQGDVETNSREITIRGASLRQCYAYFDKTLRRVDREV